VTIPAWPAAFLHRGHLGIYTHISMWLNHADATKSDAVLYFSNVNPAIPAGKPFLP
jgi:hypothetical protein